MKMKKLLVLLLCFAMVSTNTMPALAADVTVTEDEVVAETEVTEEDAEETADSESVEQEAENKETETVTEETEVVETQEATEEAMEEAPVAVAETGDTEEGTDEIDASVWTSEDFEYVDYEKELYGCDYSRIFTIKGKAIAGFSESGEAKFAKNTDVVLPAKDDQGETLMGVAPEAFKGKGLTSVKFPEGMLVDYDDTVTNVVTRRGNFVIGENAFSGNKLTSVTLPEGVIACLSNSFMSNQITTVKLPRTIWWLETQSFARNGITSVKFPAATDFGFEMHGLTFGENFIKSVRLPSNTEVVNKDAFARNTGKDPIPTEARDGYKTFTLNGITYDAGVVYMYTNNAGLAEKDRVHHIEKSTASQKSYAQKLIVDDGTTKTDDQLWEIDDFTYEGTVITGLSESGIEKRAENKDLVLPDVNANGEYITELATGPSGSYGLFGAEGQGFDTVTLPSELKVIGNFVFQNNGLKEVTFPKGLTTIGNAAFQTNSLTSIILPDSVTSLGNGAFATNPKLERIILSKGLTEIPQAAFGCSDAKNYMTELKSIELHEGITKIGSNAFAGNNFAEINIPSTVTEIGTYAFSTKEYLTDPCTLTLPEGLVKIGNRAFRNKVVEEVTLPSTLTKLESKTFERTQSSIVTKVYVSSKVQYEDTKNFPKSDYHKLYLTDPSVWTADDFTYGEESYAIWPANEYSSTENFTAYVITGFSDLGLEKLEVNKNLVIPAKDPDGKKIQGVGKNAFNKKGLENVTFPENVKTAWDDSTWETSGKGVTERGDFFIGYAAFRYNNFTTLELPEGVFFINTYAFANNTKLSYVKLPKTLMAIYSGGFYSCAIKSVDFPAETDFDFNIDKQAFCINEIKAVQLPANTEKVTDFAFLRNTGMEPVTTGNSNEKKSGLVYMYMAEAGGSFIDHVDAGSSNTQKLIIGTIPDHLAPWGVADFTYDEAGTTITGLSENGQAKIKENSALILPKVGPTGEAITALGNGASMKGIFTYAEDDKNYTPSSVVLPATLTKIGNFAFATDGTATYEAEMTSIVLPEGLVEIGISAFQNSKLTAISIPDSVTTMGSGAFTGSGALASVKLSKNVKDIPSAVFNAGTAVNMKIATIEIPEGVETIGANAFTGTHVENLTLPSTLKTIGNNAFQNHQLTEVEIPEGVTSIGNNAFKITQDGLETTLTKVVLNEGLVTIGKESFMGNAITEIELPSTVVLSASNKSADCIFGNSKTPASPIVTVKVADKVKAAEAGTEGSFNTEYANKYSHVVVYDKLVGSGWTAADFTYDEETATLTGWSESGQEKRRTIDELILPDITPEGKEITAIGEEAFKIPDDEVIVTKFGIDSPNGMTSVNLPENVKVIGKKAFSQNALTEVDFTGVTSIGESAFYGNDLVKVELPDTVTELGDGVFATNDITEVRLSESLTVIPQGAFSMNIRMSELTIPEAITEIGATAFAGARLEALTIPENVEKIGYKAFHLHHLTELVIPGNVKEIGESAFEGTFKATTLKSLIIEEGVETIGKRAFKEALLETVVFPNSLKSVGEKVFENNKGKDGSFVVEVITRNKEHKEWTDETFTIKYIANLSELEEKIQLAETSVKYTGEECKPAVTIEGLEEGKDFTVAYENNVNPGEATVTITGTGYYEGTVTKTFTIAKPVVAAQKTVSVKLYGYDDIKASWSSQKVAGATVKYKVQMKKSGGNWTTLASASTKTSYSKANLTDGAKYYFKVTPYVTVNGKTYSGTAKTSSAIYTLKKVSNPTVSKSGTKVKVKWTNINGETGYQISKSTKKTGTNIVKTVKSSTAKYTTVSATKGKTYYYKVRAYKTVDGKKIYGPWSNVKSYKRK